MIAIICGLVFCLRIDLGLNLNWYSEVFNHQIFFLETIAEYMGIKTVITDVSIITVDFHLYQ